MSTQSMNTLALLSLLVLSAPTAVHGEVYSNGYCPLLTLLPFSVAPPPSSTSLRGEDTEAINLEAAAQISYSLMASSQLAMDHFNARDSSVVPELSTELLKGCSVKFPSQLVRNTDGRSAGTKSILEDEDFYKALSNDTQRFPCAIVGPESVKKSLAMKDLTVAMDIPQMVYYPRGGGNGLFREPSMMGMSTTVRNHVTSTLSYLVDGLDRTRLAIYSGKLTDSKDYGNLVVMLAADFEGVSATVMSQSSTESTSPLKQIKASGVRTVLIDVDKNPDIAKVAEELDSCDMLNGDYFYIISTPNDPQYLLRDTVGPQEPGSALDRFLVGALVTDLLEPLELDTGEDKFLQSWKRQNGTFVEKLNTMVPMKKAGREAILQQDEDYFQTTIPSRSSSILYDTVISIGLGACRMEKEAEEQKQGGTVDERPPRGDQAAGSGDSGDTHADQQPPPQEEGSPPSGGGDSRGPPQDEGAGERPPPSDGDSRGPPPDQGEGERPPPASGDGGDSFQPQEEKPPRSGSDTDGQSDESGSSGGGGGQKQLPPLNAAIMASSFHGASGFVNFINDGGSKIREQSTLHMGAYNIRPNEIDPDTGLRTYSRVLTSVWKPDTKAWETLEGTQFLYADGTTVPPIGFVVTEKNVLYSWVRATGLSMAAISWFLAIAGGVLTWCLRTHDVVRRVQPKFQIMVCIASAIMTTSIFTLSFDEGAGWSQRQLEVACVATPWFFILGQVIAFSALFTKLWMLDRVLQFKRRKVTFQDHIWLPLLLLTFSVSILIVWTVKDPWTWERELVSTFPLESYGQCKSNNFWAYFGPLVAVLIFAQIVTVFFALKTNDVPSDFRDSFPILVAIAAQIQAWVMGMLILAVLGNSSVNATYFGRVILIWTFAVSSVVIVVWPRVIHALRLIRDPSLARRTGDRVRISGIVASTPLPTYEQPSSSSPLPVQHQPPGIQPPTAKPLSSIATSISTTYDLDSTVEKQIEDMPSTAMSEQSSSSETFSSAPATAGGSSTDVTTTTTTSVATTAIASIDATGQIKSATELP